MAGILPLLASTAKLRHLHGRPGVLRGEAGGLFTSKLAVGMRIVFVPDYGLERNPKIVVGGARQVNLLQTPILQGVARRRPSCRRKTTQLLANSR